MVACKYCEKHLEGRIGKKYCNQYCKSAHHYSINKTDEKLYHKIDRQLKTNRKILKAFNRKGVSKVRKAELIALGFDPKYFTHYYKTKAKNIYLFCYEFGFMNIDKNAKDKYLLVQWQDYMN